LIAERIFLAFDTGRGLAYAQASGWDRAYLLWTFRNFRGVPHKILNDRQRTLVETLYTAASTQLSREPDADAVIGTVEDFRPSFPAAVQAPGIPDGLVSNSPARNLENALTRNLSGLIPAFGAMKTLSSLPRRAGTGALVAMMAILGWQLLRTRPTVSASAPRPAAIPQSRVENRTGDDGAKDLGKAAVTLRMNADAQPIPAAPLPPHRAGGAERDMQQNAPQTSHQRGPNQPARNMPPTVADLNTAPDVSATPRMHISGPPRKIVYPDCADSARGKVSLLAVVRSDGAVSQVTVLTGNRLLATMAARAIRQWRYQPFSGGAQKLERETRISVAFISNDVVAVSFPDAAPVSR
jgi:hypothetical protein